MTRANVEEDAPERWLVGASVMEKEGFRDEMYIWLKPRHRTNLRK
jgi:hypothetical protein